MSVRPEVKARIDVVNVERDGQFPGQPASRQAVAAIGGYRQLDHRVIEAQHLNGVVPGCRGIRGQHDNPGVVVAEPQLGGRTDHPVGGPAVGGLRRDREIPW